MNADRSNQTKRPEPPTTADNVSSSSAAANLAWLLSQGGNGATPPYSHSPPSLLPPFATSSAVAQTEQAARQTACEHGRAAGGSGQAVRGSVVVNSVGVGGDNWSDAQRAT